MSHKSKKKNSIKYLPLIQIDLIVQFQARNVNKKTYNFESC